MGIISFINKVCVQTAVYWERPTNNGYGEQVFSLGVEISCRWDGKTKVITNKIGKEVTSMAQVLVTEELDDAGYLFLGTLDDLDTTEQMNPLLVENAYPIQQRAKTPLFKSTTEFVNTVYL